jgi:release factor glutamine methyltransferase
MNLQKNYKKINSLTFLTIVAHVIKKEKEFILAHPEYKISYFETLKIKYYLWKHKNGFPLAFITHHKEFFGLDFYVNKHTLVPRPETELLVEEVVQKIKNKELGIKKNIVLIDIGTGSGCIPIAIMKRLKHEKIKTSAIDISKKALKVARKNAAAHKVNIQFLSGNLLKPAFSVIKRSTLHNSHFTLIITGNLPYLTHEQSKT